MTEFDVSGWAPQWGPAREQLDRHRADLLSLCGCRIVDCWIVWNLELDEWFADLPVVVALDDGRQLEVCWQKFDELSITWSTIDVTSAPTAWVTWPLAWRSQGHDVLRLVHGRTIDSIFATEHRFSTWPVGRPADATSTWLVGGLWLRAGDVGLHVFDALDENGLSNDIPAVDDEHRLLPL